MAVFDLAAMQWITSTALTLGSVTIAFVVATFGYRQNYGWKPVILVLSQGVSEPSSGECEAYLEFEVWNRRKYPIAIHFVEIKFGNLKLGDIPEQSSSGAPAQWYIFHNKLVCRDQARLDPASHKGFRPRVPFKRESIDKRSETVTIEVYYFDPIANARKTATLNHELQFVGME
jgi:hypothetical protein